MVGASKEISRKFQEILSKKEEIWISKWKDRLEDK